MEPKDKIRRIAVVGAGLMGRGIAQSFLMGSYPVALQDVGESILASARAHILENMTLFCQAGLLRQEEIGPAMARLSVTTSLGEAVANADFVVEAVSEELALKQRIFREAEAWCGPDTIFASNTSSLTLREIGKFVKDRRRTVITHWLNPPQILPAVEVVKGDKTSEETMDATCALLAGIGKVPVRISREIPGFLCNRIQIAMVREVFDLCEKGVASAEDIDKAVKGTFGFRLPSVGPLLAADLGGLDLWHRVCLTLLPEIQSSTAPPAILEGLVKEGHLGIKTGKGFYDYAVDFGAKGLDEIVRRRDQELLHRLKDLYGPGDSGQRKNGVTKGARMTTINYGSRARLGMLLPSCNQAAEPQFAAMLPAGVSLHTTRLKLVGTTEEDIMGMTERLEEAAELAADAGPDLILFHCTAVTTYSPALEKSIKERIEKTTEKPATATSEAIVAALRALGAKSIVMLSPYVEAVNRREEAYFRGMGFEILDCAGLEKSDAAGMMGVPPAEWAAFARAHRNDRADAYLLSCTTVRSSDVVEELEGELRRPVITSNTATMWHCLRQMGIPDRVQGFGRLLREY